MDSPKKPFDSPPMRRNGRPMFVVKAEYTVGDKIAWWLYPIRDNQDLMWAKAVGEELAGRQAIVYLVASAGMSREHALFISEYALKHAKVIK